MTQAVADPKKQGAPEEEARMSFGEHLEELRSRLLKSVVMLLLAVLGLMFNYEYLLRIIVKPHYEADIMIRDAARLEGRPEPPPFNLISGDYVSPITSNLKMVFIFAVYLCSPWIGYQAWAFVAAGLYRAERKYIALFAPFSFALFTGGAAFGFMVLVPYGLYGLARMVPMDLVTPLYKVSDYLNLVMMLTIIMGAIFQLPLIMTFCSMVGLIAPSSYNKWRRAAIVVNVIFAAVITPADIFTMILVAIPLLLLYEIGVVSAFIFGRRATSPRT